MNKLTNRVIFVVDDTPANLHLLFDILFEAGYETRVFQNGLYLLDAMKNIKPDLILLDIMMPEIDGYEICKIIRAQYGTTIPIIFLSALTESYDKVRAFEVGGQDYITKPIHPQEVLLRVDAQLKRIEEREQLTLDVQTKERQLQEYQEGLVKTLLRLSSLRDHDTGNHIERVNALATTLAERLAGETNSEIDHLFIEALRLAAPLHDIGKISVPDAILLKPGKLDKEEWQIMQEHVRVGAEVLYELNRQFPGNYFINMAIDIALYHHERWDGNGYIHGLSGTEIPLAARIVSIVDVYDALRTNRPYKAAYSHEKAMEIMLGMDGAFDPRLMRLFERYDFMFSKTFDCVYQEEVIEERIANDTSMTL